ncbi:transposase, partial [Fredinandcohnia quinoae]
GRILNATVRRNPSGKYFVSILAETEVHSLGKTGSSVGVDLGLKDFAILSTGEVFSNPKWFHKLEEKLANAQRILSRRVKGSSNWNKQRIKVTRI